MARSVAVLIPENPEKLADLTRKLDEINSRIRRHAQQIVADRAGRCQPLDDWFQAEAELFEIPHARVEESPEQWDITIDVAGYEPEQIVVNVLHYAVAVEGHLPGHRPLFRQFSFTTPVDHDHVTVHFLGDVLHIAARKFTLTATRSFSATAGVAQL